MVRGRGSKIEKETERISVREMESRVTRYEKKRINDLVFQSFNFYFPELINFYFQCFLILPHFSFIIYYFYRRFVLP